MLLVENKNTKFCLLPTQSKPLPGTLFCFYVPSFYHADLMLNTKAYEFTKQSKRNDALKVRDKIKFLQMEHSKEHRNINRINLDTIYTHLAPFHYSLTPRSYQNFHSRLSLRSLTTSNTYSFRNGLKIYTHYWMIYGARGGVVVEALRYKLAGRGSHS